MRRHISVLLILLLAFSGGLFAQTISNISPTQVVAGSAGFTLTVNGSNFVLNPNSGHVSTVYWNGVAIPTPSVTPTQLTASVSAALVASPGPATITVKNSPTSPPSNSATLQIETPVTITTTSPLPSGMVGAAYSIPLAATGGIAPYSNWRIVEGAVPGLSMSTAGVLSGTPATVGTYGLIVGVDSSGGGSATKTFSLTVSAPPLVITTTSALPGGTVGVAYSQTFEATGGIPSYTWTAQTSALPPGLTMSAGGVLSGTPTQSGPFSFTASVTDSLNTVTTASFSLTVNAALAITTASPLPNGTVGVAYSQQTFAATGGTPSYTWTAQISALPPGLTVSTAGVLSGTPTQAGTSNFTVTVTDSAQRTASKQFTLTVAVPPLPTLSFSGLSSTVSPLQQPSFNVELSAPYPLPITGSISITSKPNDPNIGLFSGGVATSPIPFTIPANQTSVTLSPSATLQTGTVAGTITLTSAMTIAGQVTSATQSVTVASSAPVITSVQVSKVSPGFSVLIRGYSTPRQMTQATFIFTGTNLQGGSAVILLDTTFGPWYAGSSSTPFGSQFLYTQPFTIQGDINAITSVSVTLQNTVGSSQAMGASF